MVVVEQMELDVRPHGGPSLYRGGLDDRVARALEDLDRLRDVRRGRVVLRRILVEGVADGHDPAEAVVEHLEGVGAAPGVEAPIAEVAEAVGGKVERRREQDDPRDTVRMA